MKQTPTNHSHLVVFLYGLFYLGLLKKIKSQTSVTAIKTEPESLGKQFQFMNSFSVA